MPETDEFSFLPAQAAAAGVDVPRVERVGLTLPDGRALSGLRWGEGSPRVTLLHGAGLNAHTWDTTLLHLGVPALALDLAGHGDSSWREDAAYVGRVLAPDVATALEAWTDGPQVLVGHSLGGLTAAALAASRPDLVDMVVIVDITPGIDPSGGPAQLRAFFAGPTDWASRDELVDKALAFGLGGARPAAERGVFLNTRVRPDGRIEWKHHFAHLAAAAAAAGADTATPDAVRAVLASTGWDDIAAVRAPIVLVRADRGFVSADDADELVRRASDARVRVVPTAHNVQEEDPAGLASLLRETLAAA
ncbi:MULTISPECIES: alpha/beta fold hydrolase [unclassified Microbacterium]|uniref:alpha/beta fold hydrolase n=1 Tax=unclassified Microbacterium TaxID=2609290 RepID=UPI00097C6EA9|nr:MULTISPECIES: alpha/beta hydrolase [unclassified Microbacterium]MDI9892166.1 alpha/beta hydrolase [Microbacterium sp. IEGM 1404]MXS74854.1 alpha/beta hydrolase [Microbacterium sp. TL13]ONI65695.1 alpha/beta hydrolase [Microbacterium sp. CSI-V]